MSKPAHLLTSLVLGLFLLGQPAASAAQGFKWWQSDRFQDDLLLTSEQVDRLEEVFQALQATLKTQKDTLDKYEAKLSRIVTDPRSDEEMVLLAVERVEAARGALSKSRTLMMFRMNRILTSDQNVKMKALHEQWNRERRNRPPVRHDHMGR